MNKPLEFNISEAIKPYPLVIRDSGSETVKDNVNYKISAVIADNGNRKIEKRAELKSENIVLAKAAQENISTAATGKEKVVSRRFVIITAYSSTPDQTDSTPFITASNKYVRDGIVAANFLPFGTKIKIPAIYSDKIFTVEDRMKSNTKVDIWFPTRQEALNFGAKRAEIEILEIPE